MRRCSVLLLAWLWVVCASPGSHVSAQAVSEDGSRAEPRASSAGSRAEARASSSAGDAAPAGYKSLVDEALDEFDRANFARSRTLFQEAHAMWPSARTLRALAMCELELKSYVAAVAHFEQALASDTRPLNDVQRRETLNMLDRARGFVARLTVETVPSDAQVAVDGAEAQLDARRSVLLAVGPHELDVRAPGYAAVQRQVQVEGRFDHTVRIELSPAAAAATLVTTSEGAMARSDEERPAWKKWAPWVAVATVATAALVTGLVIAARDPEPERASGGTSGIVIPVSGGGR